MPAELPDTEPTLSATAAEVEAIGPHLLPAEQPVLISRYLEQGWRLLWANPGPYIGYAVIVLLVLFVLQSLWGIGQLLTATIGAPLIAGFYYALRRQIHGRSFQFTEFFSGFNHFLPLMLVGLLSAILITIGMFLLLLPGIYLMVGYLFAVPLAQDRELEFWDAMETSRRLITRQWFGFFGLTVLLLVVNAVGAMLAGLGLLLTMPFSAAVIAAAYHHQIGFRPAD